MLKFLLALFISTPAISAPVYYKVKDSSRVIKVIGRVDGTILDTAAELEKLSRKSNEPIFMLINSPGGSVQAGMAFIDAMRVAKARGVVFYCASQVMAASMAFTFLNECQYRYAMENTRLLFHPISLSTKGSRLQELLVDLQYTEAEEKDIMRDLQAKLGLDWKTFHKNYFAETFWQAKILAEVTKKSKWLKIVQRIEGFGDDIFKYKKPQPLFMFNTAPGSNNDAIDRILERYENGR